MIGSVSRNLRRRPARHHDQLNTLPVTESISHVVGRDKTAIGRADRSFAASTSALSLSSFSVASLFVQDKAQPHLGEYMVVPTILPRRAVALPPRRKQNRIAILEAAHALLRFKGPDSLTMDDVACEANVSRRTIYNHFADIRALFEQSRRALLARLVPLVPTLIPSQTSPQQALTRFTHQAVRVFDDPSHTCLVISLIRDVDSHDWVAEAYDANIIAPMTGALAAYLVEQRVPGDVRVKAGQVLRLLQSFSLSRHLFGQDEAATTFSIEPLLASMLAVQPASPMDMVARAA